jgi:hypothetical protein
MSPSWTLRTIHFSNFKTKKILMEELGNLEICNISYLMFGVFERLFITRLTPGNGNDGFFERRKGQEVVMNENTRLTFPPPPGKPSGTLFGNINHL